MASDPGFSECVKETVSGCARFYPGMAMGVFRNTEVASGSLIIALLSYFGALNLSNSVGAVDLLSRAVWGAAALLRLATGDTSETIWEGSQAGTAQLALFVGITFAAAALYFTYNEEPLVPLLLVVVAAAALTTRAGESLVKATSAGVLFTTAAFVLATNLDLPRGDSFEVAAYLFAVFLLVLGLAMFTNVARWG